MSNHTRRARGLLAAAAVALLAAAQVAAAPLNSSEAVVFYGSSLSETPTADIGGAVSDPLCANAFVAVADMDVSFLAEAVSGPPPLEYLPERTNVVAYNAPPVVHALDTASQPPVHFATYRYPEVTGLADLGSGGRDVPLGDTTFFSMGPGGFGGYMSGRPSGGVENWTHITRTAISYIRPSVNVQMMLALEVPGTPPANDFEGPGMESRVYLAVDRQTRVDSADIGASTSRFGRRAKPTPIDEPQTAVSAGLDLGLLPTFLSQMGLGVSVVASRGQETGNLRIALVGTTELPVDWAPRERPYQHPVGMAVNPLLSASPYDEPYPSGGVSGGGPPGDPGDNPGDGPTPITPTPVPEPATAALLVAGAAMAIARRTRRRR